MKDETCNMCRSPRRGPPLEHLVKLNGLTTRPSPALFNGHVNQCEEVLGPRVLWRVQIMLERRGVTRLVAASWQPSSIKPLIGVRQGGIWSEMTGDRV